VHPQVDGSTAAGRIDWMSLITTVTATTQLAAARTGNRGTGRLNNQDKAAIQLTTTNTIRQ